MSAAEFFDAIRSGEPQPIAEMLAAAPELALARDEEGRSPILFALYHGHDEVVETICSAGHLPDIFEAAAVGDLDRVDTLLDDEPTEANAWSDDGFTAIHLAAFFGHLSVVKALVESEAAFDLPASNSLGVRPLHAAAAMGQHRVMALLLEHGAEVDAVQPGGFTALHSAAQSGNVNMVDLLLAHGADAARLTDDGKTAADIARAAEKDGSKEVVQRLQASLGES